MSAVVLEAGQVRAFRDLAEHAGLAGALEGTANP
jgi:hypothetical protein